MMLMLKRSSLLCKMQQICTSHSQKGLTQNMKILSNPYALKYFYGQRNSEQSNNNNSKSKYPDNLKILENSQAKEDAMAMLEEAPEDLEEILKQIQNLPLLHKDKAAEIFEKKFFRNYVYVVDQYLRKYRIDLQDRLVQNIRLVSRIAQIYQSLGKLQFQKQDVFTKKIVQLSSENIQDLDLVDLNRLFFVMSTFNIRNANEEKLFQRLQELIQILMSSKSQKESQPNKNTIDTSNQDKRKEITQETPLTNEQPQIKKKKSKKALRIAEEIVGIHFNIAKMASQRRGDKESLMVILDMLNSYLFNNLDLLVQESVSKILSALSLVQFKVNKLMLIKLTQILLEDDPSMPTISLHKKISSFVAVTSLEGIYTTGLFYLYELDKYYNQMFEVIHKSIDSFSPSMLGTISSSLQRISHYDSSLLIRIAQKIMTYDLYGFEDKDECAETVRKLKETSNKLKILKKQLQDINNGEDEQAQQSSKQQKGQNKNRDLQSKKSAEKLDEMRQLEREERQLKYQLSEFRRRITKSHNNLNALFKIVHCLGLYNIREDENVNQQIVQKFLSYFYKVIELYAMKLQQEGSLNGQFDPKYVTRCVWALCIVDSPENIAQPLHILINHFLFSQDSSLYQLQKADVSVLYYAYLVNQKNSTVFPQYLLQIIQTVYTEQVLKGRKNVSILCMDVQKHLQELKIPSKIEINIDNILVDIQIPSTLYGKQIVLDVHGYQHYFRNCDRLKGNTNLKRQIIENFYNFAYEIVPVFEWELLDKAHKHEYLLSLLENLKGRIEQSIEQKK